MKKYPKYYIPNDPNDLIRHESPMFFKENDNKGNVTHFYKNYQQNNKWRIHIFHKYIKEKKLKEIPIEEVALMI